jgi:glycerol-3-phosphate dehydrogenase
VLFAVPWLGKVILGTTDTPRHDLPLEPDPFADEIEFILTESARYLRKPPSRADVKSVWVGLRPLVKSPDAQDGNTKRLSREHTILVSSSGLVTVTGGKWTTYRAMAEDVLANCEQHKLIRHTVPGVTRNMQLLGAQGLQRPLTPMSAGEGYWLYGSEAEAVRALPGADHWLVPGLSEAMVRFAARYEYAVTVEDVLARRSRLLFLDASLAAQIAPTVSVILGAETGLDSDLAGFEALCPHYLLTDAKKFA